MNSVSVNPGIYSRMSLTRDTSLSGAIQNVAVSQKNNKTVWL